MKKAVFFHSLLNETYEIGHENGMTLEKAWSLFSFACIRMGWEEDVTLISVSVK